MIKLYLRTIVHLCLKTKLGVGISGAILLATAIILSWASAQHNERINRVQTAPSDAIEAPLTFTFAPQPQPIPIPPPPQATTVAVPPAPTATNVGTHFQATNLLALRSRKNLTAPALREVRCATTAAAISGSDPARIRALVTEPLYHKGILIIPKNTEVFGRLTGATDGDRLLTQDRWKLIFKSDFTLDVTATPTYRYESGAKTVDALKEGSQGLWGYRFQSMSAREIKLFAATFLSAVAQSIQQTRASAFGYILKDSAQNSAAQGLSALLNQYGEQLLATIKREQFAILVPPGSPFWLSIEDPLSIPPSAVSDSETTTPFP
jgi:hypothetical protein